MPLPLPLALPGAPQKGGFLCGSQRTGSASGSACSHSAPTLSTRRAPGGERRSFRSQISSKMPSEWSNELTIQFLELLETEKVIWDVENKQHKQKHKVHDAWKKISVALDIPIDELKSKKKSLMATFRPLLKKKHNSIRSGAGTDDIFNPIWFAFDIMERFLGPSFTVDDTVNTEEQLLQNDTTMMPPKPPTPPTQGSNDDETMPPKPPQTKEKESSQTVHYTATKTNAKKRHMDHIISKADQKINDSLETLSNILKTKKREEDECDVYASLLAKKLRKYPERMRDRIMYKIDGLLLDNPYPNDERSSSAPPSAQQTISTPSPQYVPTPSPQYFPTPSPQYFATPSPQYDPPVYVLPPQNLPASTSQAPVYLHIPEENINMQNEVILQSSTKERKNIAEKRQIHVLSQEIIVPSAMSDIIKYTYNDS